MVSPVYLGPMGGARARVPGGDDGALLAVGAQVDGGGGGAGQCKDGEKAEIFILRG
ncbi:hypothetical protein MGG_16896 [Pyricularia oryzae 70-15]|uniref:Uncharacterized protein n=2 Tax=Pyricularia oryzae TaxID=318829 RepID=G4N5D5_PYRO7|nr:uncharacterized protein MGG_16896 [Pyricularia oryzae 70-15]EHA52992.1 hypothetical protein MGG_16896 [Pyricularia oryzae 70-15]ELQ35391.1 hypothetical protein OOU_Y34scaffold00711g31 [Pyricularia oryzae Y34]